MSQKIPFFELFSALPLDRETRVALDGAYLTAVEVERERRTMHMALTVRADMGERMSQISAAVGSARGLLTWAAVQLLLRLTSSEVSEHSIWGPKNDLYISSCVRPRKF